MSKFNRWIRSKNGLIPWGSSCCSPDRCLVGQGLGWWKAVGLTGTAGIYDNPLPDPPGGVTCLPTCSETDGRFMTMPSEDMASFGGQTNTAWISVPAGKANFTVDIFDGDAGKNTNQVRRRTMERKLGRNY